MKKIYYFLLSLTVLLTACGEDYDLSTGFTVPNALNGPASVKLDLSSSENIVFSWEGGKANDGGILIYQILFDKESGNFSDPLLKLQSDLGGLSKRTLTHVELNKMARQAGLKTGESGSFKWTVTASRGGVEHMAEVSEKVTLTRPDEEIPEQLYLRGTATENPDGNSAFRTVSDGAFTIYTTLKAGNLLLADAENEDAALYTVDGSSKIVEGSNPWSTEAYDSPIRMTINFNTKQISIDRITGIRMIWGCSFGVIANMNYVGGGIFESRNTSINFVIPGGPGAPEWLGWVEERYYFIATVNGADICWGRMDGVHGERPSDTEPISFYEIGEFPWSQWDHLWKMAGKLDGKSCTVTIDTNKDGLMIHQFTDIQ
ncbi:SusE domain-containing protein [Bacteroides sp. 51]|uniref:SusE domain-containing protein n=1 Tax=Bacteroides sp. 51 TaxID=2302938 RepID=UPI0013D0EC2C|nr:SusE domain-containing protein [Bacteroides sp. 51]NDV82615.1 hypothetical protein [Bacteroides sp. 51]